MNQQVNIKPRALIQRVTERMFSMRKKASVEKLPYTPYAGYHTSWPGFWFSKVIDRPLCEGDYIYAIAELPGPYARKLLISLTGDTEIAFNGEVIKGYPNGGMRSYPVQFREGKNLLLVRYRLSAPDFGFEIYIGTEEMPVYWPSAYLYKTRPVIPVGQVCGMEGFAYSRPYTAAERQPAMRPEEIEWIGPRVPECPKTLSFDFDDMTDEAMASALTRASGFVQLRHNAPITVCVNGQIAYRAESGTYAAQLPSETELCVVAERRESDFGFTVVSGSFSLPFYKTEHRDLCWLWLEGVSLADEAVQFKKPYRTQKGKTVFYRFGRQNTYLRLYLNTAFFGQWFYAIMVGLYGVLKMAERLEQKTYIDYFVESMCVLEDYYDYAQYDAAQFGFASFLSSSCNLHDLDGIGTIGMNTGELLRITKGAHGKRLFYELEKALSNVPRTKDGVFYRIQTFWADDFFMGIPFLARLAAIGGKTEYFDEAVRQVRGWYSYLYMEDKQIFSHIYFVEQNKPNRIPWGRGNGWVLFALSELLEYLPQTHPGYPDMLSRFQTLAKGILRYQDAGGMWHQVLDEPETYEESSGTAMFIIGLARGIKKGWLDSEITPSVWRAWNRLATVCVTKQGDVEGICIGSGCHMERSYYQELGACENDDHGVGVLLLAATEMLDLPLA